MAHNDSAHQKTYLWLTVVLAFGLTLLFWMQNDKIETTVKAPVPAAEQSNRTGVTSNKKPAAAEAQSPAQAIAVSPAESQPPTTEGH